MDSNIFLHMLKSILVSRLEDKPDSDVIMYDSTKATQQTPVSEFYSVQNQNNFRKLFKPTFSFISGNPILKTNAKIISVQKYRGFNPRTDQLFRRLTEEYLILKAGQKGKN